MAHNGPQAYFLMSRNAFLLLLLALFAISPTQASLDLANALRFCHFDTDIKRLLELRMTAETLYCLHMRLDIQVPVFFDCSAWPDCLADIL